MRGGLQLRTRGRERRGRRRRRRSRWALAASFAGAAVDSVVVHTPPTAPLSPPSPRALRPSPLTPADGTGLPDTVATVAPGTTAQHTPWQRARRERVAQCHSTKRNAGGSPKGGSFGRHTHTTHETRLESRVSRVSRLLALSLSSPSPLPSTELSRARNVQTCNKFAQNEPQARAGESIVCAVPLTALSQIGIRETSEHTMLTITRAHSTLGSAQHPSMTPSAM